MIEPKKFKINSKVSQDQLLKSGFVRYSGEYFYKRYLYCYDNTKNPYVTFKMIIYFEGNIPIVMYSIVCEDGCCYPPFYDPDVRYNNSVYEKTVKVYNEVIDRLIRNNILKEDNKNE